MTEQSNAAAERSAHVERGPGRRIPGESFLVEVSPGIFKLKAVVEAEREVERLRAECQRLAGEVSRAHKDALGWMERAAAARDAGRIEGATVGAEDLAAARREGIEAAWGVVADEPVPEGKLTFHEVMQRDERMMAAIRALVEGGQ